MTNPDAFTPAFTQAAELHPLCGAGEQLADILRGMQWASFRPPKPLPPAPDNVSAVRMLTARPGKDWAIMPASKLHPGYLRMLAEAAIGDLLTTEDGVLYRRVQTDTVTPFEERRLGFAPVGSIASSYGITRASDIENGVESLMADALKRAGRIIRRGMTWRCKDGRIVAWQGSAGRRKSWWAVAACRNGADPIVTGSAHMPADAAVPDCPTTYERVVDATVDDARRLATSAERILRAWCAPDGGPDNLLLMVGSPFLRDHPEVAYTLQGPGGTGKSTIARALMEHLNGQAMTFSLDLLAQPTAMSTENAMGDLGSHLLALSDDFDPRWGRLERVLPPLKTLLTGILPFSARRRGQDAVQMTPRAVHVITTNFPLLTNDSAERRRFAFAVITDPTHRALDRFDAFMDCTGFWPFMLASALAWVAREGVHETRVQPAVDADTLGDDEEQVIRAVLDNGCILPTERPFGWRGSWKSVGLRKSTRRVDGRTVTVYAPPRESDPEWPTWKAMTQALDAIPMDPSMVTATPMPDRNLATMGLCYQLPGSAWFPCQSDGKHMKAPDGKAIAERTGLSSWKKAAEQHADLMDGPWDDDHRTWGLTLPQDMVAIDCDIDHETGANGWDVLQETMNVAYGSDAMPRTFVSRTPSGGAHLIYRIPKGVKLKNIVHQQLADGFRVPVDVRAGRLGYIIAPGSKTSAGEYRLVDAPADGEDIPMLPECLYDLLARLGGVDGVESDMKKAEKTASAQSSRHDDALRRALWSKPHSFNRTPIPEGSRNDTISRQVWGHLCNGTPLDVVMEGVLDRARNSGLPEAEARGIVERAARKLHITA